MLLTVLLIVGLLLLTQVVPTTVTPPARPASPVTVFLVDFGRTPALVLPVSDSTMICYVYGDWNYYALRNRGVFDALAALFWPTQGALGRKEIAGPPDPETVRREIGTSIEYLHAFEVERETVERLHAALDQLYRDGLGTAVPSHGMTFVHHPRPYTYWSNSNRMTAEWMRQLGCKVRGPAFNSWWRIRMRH